MKANAVLPPLPLEGRDREAALTGFLILTGLFVASLVSCNLIFRKFFVWELGGLTFEQSVGLLPYPLTFLITDVISEVYGRRKAQGVVLAGLAASFMTLLVIALAGHADAAVWSPVTDAQFDHVFGQTVVAVGASMAAYLLAQFLTEGRHLWLRNNLSTIPSQLLDTLTVLVLLCLVGEIPWERFGALLLNGVAFKALVAALDTPLVYLAVGWMRRRFALAPGQEIAL